MKNRICIMSDKNKFIEVWGLVHTNIRMFDYWLEKNNFSIPEKRLLQAFYFFRKNKKDETLNLLKGKIDGNVFLEGVRCYLIGLVYNQYGHFFYAIEHLELAVSYFEEANEEEFIVNPLSLLVNVYSNRRDLKKMSYYLDVLKKYKPKNDLRKLQIQYCEMNYYSLTGNIHKAEKIYKKLEKDKLAGHESFKPYFIVNLFMVNVQHKRFEQCFKLLDVYKKITTTVVKANYLYMKILLEHLVQQKPIYAYEKDFKEYPEMFHQLEVIKALKIGDEVKAKKFWDLLAKHNPNLYGEYFQFLGEHSLFYQTLALYKNYLEEEKIDLEAISLLPNTLEKLAYIFEKTQKPLTNEILVQYIWGEELTDVTLARLRKLISNYNKKYHSKIKASQATYKILKKSS